MSTTSLYIEIKQHLQSALSALDDADNERLRTELEAIMHCRDRSSLLGLSTLSNELNHALLTLPRIGTALGQLPDASARLEKVVEMTEASSMRTLDLVEEAQRSVERFSTGNSEREPFIQDIKHNLRELALGQSYQDLTGQIIRKVSTVMRKINEHLAEINLIDNYSSVSADEYLSGPAIAGIDANTSSQNDADDLLSRLGI